MSGDPTLDDRLLRDFRALVRATFPQLTYLGKWLYVVQATDGTTIDAVAASDGTDAQIKTIDHLPDVTSCPLHPDILGAQVHPKVGSVCIIEFINGDPTRPICTGGDPANPPDSSKLHGGGPAAARVGDKTRIFVGFATVLGVPLFLIGDSTGPRWGVTAPSLAASALAPGLVWGVGPYPSASEIEGNIKTGSSKCQIGG